MEGVNVGLGWSKICKEFVKQTQRAWWWWWWCSYRSNASRTEAWCDIDLGPRSSAQSQKDWFYLQGFTFQLWRELFVGGTFSHFMYLLDLGVMKFCGRPCTGGGQDTLWSKLWGQNCFHPPDKASQNAVSFGGQLQVLPLQALSATSGIVPVHQAMSSVYKWQ